MAEFGAAGGAASYARLPPLPTLPHALAQAFQLEFWVKTERTDGVAHPFVSRRCHFLPSLQTALA